MPTRAQLAQRRALVAAATKRHPPRPVPAAPLPRPTVLTRALVEIAEELNEGLLAKPAVRLQLPRAYLRLTQPSAGLHGQAQQGARCQALRGTPERTRNEEQTESSLMITIIY